LVRRILPGPTAAWPWTRPTPPTRARTRTRVKPTVSGVTLTTKEVIAEVQIPYDVLEDNIERGGWTPPFRKALGGLHQTIIDLIAERAALDLEELGGQGRHGLRRRLPGSPGRVPQAGHLQRLRREHR
jgi:hypothetical protein